MKLKNYRYKIKVNAMFISNRFMQFDTLKKYHIALFADYASVTPKCVIFIAVALRIGINLIIMLYFALRGYSTPGPYFWRLCAFSQKNKATFDKASYGSGQKCSKALKNHSFTSGETIAVKL